MRDAAASKYAKQVQAAFVRAGFNPSTVQAAAGAAPSAQPTPVAPPTTPPPETPETPTTPDTDARSKAEKQKEEAEAAAAQAGPAAQASTREMAMVASRLTPKGEMIMSGELAKTFSKPPHNLSPEEITAVQGILAQWLEPMGLELMENLLRLLKRRLIEQTVGQVASTTPAPRTRTGRTKVEPAAKDPKLQPLDLAQIYNVIEDPNKARTVAGFIASKFRPAGVRVVNYQPPTPDAGEGEGTRATDATGAGEGEGTRATDATGAGEGEGAAATDATGAEGAAPGEGGGKTNLIATAVAEAASGAVEEVLAELFEKVVNKIPFGSLASDVLGLLGADPEDAVAKAVMTPLKGAIEEMLGGLKVIDDIDKAAQVILGDDAKTLLILAKDNPPAVSGFVKGLDKLKLIKGLVKAADTGLLGKDAAGAIQKVRDTKAGKIPIGDKAMDWLLDKKPPPGTDPKSKAEKQEDEAGAAKVDLDKLVAGKFDDSFKRQLKEKPADEVKAWLEKADAAIAAAESKDVPEGTTDKIEQYWELYDAKVKGAEAEPEGETTEVPAAAQQEHMIYERWQKIAGINKKVL